MAIFPCDVGLHRNPGKNMNMYVGVLNQGTGPRMALRLCEGHWREVEPHLTEYEVITDGSDAPYGFGSFVCGTCGQILSERGAQVFVTAYPPKQDRKDYWFQVHSECPLPSWMPKEPNRARA